MSRSVFTLSQRPDLEDEVRRIGTSIWPEFMLRDPVADRYWERLFTEFPDFQIAICDSEDGVVAVGNTVPFTWDGTPEGLPAGWDAVLEQGLRERERGMTPTDLSALLAVVDREHQGRGLSYAVLNAMRDVTAKQGLGSLLAPVRPTVKNRYPRVPTERYIGWTREDGEIFDPWLRVHARLGAGCLASRRARWRSRAKYRTGKSGRV